MLAPFDSSTADCKGASSADDEEATPRKSPDAAVAEAIAPVASGSRGPLDLLHAPAASNTEIPSPIRAVRSNTSAG
jgi:hypothetical protein